MKRMMPVLLLLLLVSTVCASPDAKREYRIGLKGGSLYPAAGSDTLVKTDTMMLMLELDVKRGSQLDTGFRFGYDAYATRAPNYYACYDLFQFGYGARYYFDERKSPETEFHVFKRYVMADGYLTMASKTKDLDSSIVSPQNLYGLGVKAGAGLEYVFGPLSSGFVDVEYLIMNNRTSNGAYEFPVNGLVLAFGVRLAK